MQLSHNLTGRGHRPRALRHLFTTAALIAVIGPPLAVLAQDGGHQWRHNGTIQPQWSTCQGQPSTGNQPPPAPRGPEWTRIDQAINTLRQAYASRSGGETFEEAARRIVAAQQGQMREMATGAASEAITSQSFGNMSSGVQAVSGAVNQSRTASQFTRQEREGVVAGAVGAVGSGIRLHSSSDRIAVEFSRNVIETMSREVGIDPALAERARELANSAVDLAEYRNEQTQQDVSRAERMIERTEAIAETTTVLERAGSFRDDNSTDLFSIQVGDIFLQIDSDGSISYTGPDPSRPGTQRTRRDELGNLRVTDTGELISVSTGPGRGSMPTAANIERTRAYLRSMGPEGQAALDAFDRELERIQRRASRPRSGGGAGGGGGGSGGAQGFVESMDGEGAPDPDLLVLQEAARALARGGLRLQEGASGPPFIIRRFLAGGNVLQVIELAEIYTNYNLQNGPLIVRSGPSAVGSGPSTIMNTPSSAGQSPSSVGRSLSAVGTSLSSAGTSMSSVGTSLSSVGTTPSAVWWSGSAAGLNTGSLVWTTPDFWAATGITSASDWTDPNRRSVRAPASRRSATDIPQELCGR